MKKGLMLIALLAAVLMLTGCNLVGYDQELDNAQVVARVGDTELTKAEWLAYRDYMASYYSDYYEQYFGFSMPLTDETIASYGESALESMIESVVLQDKIVELGFDPLSEEDAAEVESYADMMMDLYKQLIRYQEFADIETVEEEYARLSAALQPEATPGEPTPAEPVPAPTVDPEQLVATMTDAELDAMLLEHLEQEHGYTHDYFVKTQTSSLQSQMLRDSVTADVTVSDEEIRAAFDSRVEAQKTSYDATPTLYASAINAGSDVFYTPEGYRGVKHILVALSDEDQAAINEMNTTLTTAQNALTSAQEQLDNLNGEDTSDYDEEALAAYQEQVAALEEQVTQATTTIEETQKALDEATEAAFAAVLPTAEEALAKAQAGEDFDALIEEYGDDPGMRSEPASTQGYLICDGLSLYVAEFQDAAMALENVGDISDLVKTSYGYHILKYEMDIPSGPVEYTDEIAENLGADLLSEAQDAAYKAAVTQWVSEAKVVTYPKVME